MEDKPIVKIIKQPDDPLAIRVSAGGRPDIGYYCSYRGDLEDCRMVLEIILDSIKSVQEADKKNPNPPKR